jgi:hypothetical protein
MNVADRVQFGRYTSVYAKMSLGQDCDEGQRAERLKASFEYALRVLTLTLYHKREVFDQAATFMMATKEEESVWIPDFESPEVEQTVQTNDPGQ